MVLYSEIGGFCDLDFLSTWSVMDSFACDSNLLNFCEVISLPGIASTFYLFTYMHHCRNYICKCKIKKNTKQSHFSPFSIVSVCSTS